MIEIEHPHQSGLEQNAVESVRANSEANAEEALEAPRGREEDEESDDAVADYDYAFENIEYLKPVLVRFPGGTIAIGTESSDPNWVRGGGDTLSLR